MVLVCAFYAVTRLPTNIYVIVLVVDPDVTWRDARLVVDPDVTRLIQTWRSSGGWSRREALQVVDPDVTLVW